MPEPTLTLGSRCSHEVSLHPHCLVWYSHTLLSALALPGHCLSQPLTHYHRGSAETSSTQHTVHPTSSQGRARLHTAAWGRQQGASEQGGMSREEGQCKREICFSMVCFTP